MYKICKNQLMQALATPRIYIALFLGSVMQIISVMPLFDFSRHLGRPLSIFEGFIYFNCDTYIASAAFLGFILLVSDIPFSSQEETYILIRLSRREWISGKILYLFIASCIYYLIIAFVGIVFILENSYFGNYWSEPIYNLVKDVGSSLAVKYNVYFPYSHILLGLTPAKALMASFFLSVSYGFIMSLIFFLFNLKFSRAFSYISAIMFHVIGYLLAALFTSYFYIKFSLLGNSLLMYHNIGSYYEDNLFTTLPQAFLLFFSLSVIVAFMIFKAIKQYDFRISVGVRK